MGMLNIFAGIGFAISSASINMSKMLIDLNSKLSLRLLAGLTASSTEATYDLISYLILKISAMFNN